jgi:class 3 adenylate cyclase
VTVLFADVVHSMDIASVVGAERLREIMTDLFNRSALIVHYRGGTVVKFTGDGIMALFGAPAALEDHALRACLAALGIQQEAQRLAAEVHRRDCVDLQLRVGLDSGQVVTGEIGSSPTNYTAIGEQVGMSQRMESVAPPGGVMLSASTARLVEPTAVLGAPEMVHFKGVNELMPARRLLAMSAQPGRIGRPDTTLVGRQGEMKTLTAMLRRSISGHGCVVGVAGPAGIGKSRLVSETAAIAKSHGVEVFLAFCESHGACRHREREIRPGDTVRGAPAAGRRAARDRRSAADRRAIGRGCRAGQRPYGVGRRAGASGFR